MLAFYGEPQWAVVGDTFPVGCAWSDKIVYHQYFQNNTDSQNPVYQTKYGIYSAGCGLDNLHMSWGHDEYMAMVATKNSNLPPEAIFIIRYHSFYPLHDKGAYEYFMNDKDREMLPILRKFQKYDLYSKSDETIDVKKLEPYYKELISEFFPDIINW